jgi:trimethylamine-N-oxide reductase (cytochrome c)
MAEAGGRRTVYVSHPASGLARSNFPLACEVAEGRILRSRPFFLPEDLRRYEIRTTARGSFQRGRKEVQMPLAFAWRQRVHAESRLRTPLLREDWSPENRNPAGRGRSGYRPISWDQALDIVVAEIERIHRTHGSLEPVLVQADGHGQSGYLQSLHFWGHYLFDMLRTHKGWGWWTQQVRNPDSWEGYYWGAKHVWGFNASLGEPYQDAVWDDVLEHAEMVIFAGNDPEATGFGMSGSIALEMPKWLKRAGIRIVALAPDLNHAAAVHADTWIPLRPNTDAALYLAIAHCWIAAGSYDKEYVASHTIGFEAFRAHVLGEDDGVAKTPAWAAAITGVPVHTIKALASEWAARRTTLSVYFGGPKIRGTHSHLAARLEAYVLAMQGFGKPGRQFLRTGAPSFYKKNLAQVPRYREVDQHGVALNWMIEYAIGHGPSSPVFVPRTLAAEAILEGSVAWRGTTAALAAAEDQFKSYRFPPDDSHPGIRMVWHENGSQPGSWGHGWKWLEALRSARIDFVVGVHPWMENDLPFSDRILPAQTNYEHEDLVTVQRSDLLGMFWQDQAIEPVGEALSDYEIHRRIGLRFGLDAAFPPAETWLREAYEKTLAHTAMGVSWEAFRDRKYVIYDCPTWEEWVEIKRPFGYEEHTGGLHWFWRRGEGLETPSGKIEFVSKAIAAHDAESRERPPLARWTLHPEQREAPRGAAYPLLMMSNHPRFRFHVQGDDLPWIREIGKIRGADGYFYEPCRLHPDDAQARGIVSGDVVRVFNHRGAVLAGAVVTRRLIAGAVAIDHGARIDRAWYRHQEVDRGGSINLIAPTPHEKYAPGAEIAVPEMNVSGFHVEVEKIDPADIVPMPAPGGGA